MPNTDEVAELDCSPAGTTTGEITGSKEPYRDEPSEMEGVGTEVSAPTEISEPTDRGGPSERGALSDLTSEPKVDSPK